MRNMHVRHGIRQIAVVGLVALAMTACSKKEEAPPASPVATAAPAAAAPAAVPNTPPAATVSDTPPAAAVPGAAAAPVIATAEANAPGLRVEINELRRTGNDMVTMRMTFINDRQEKVQPYVSTAFFFDYVNKQRFNPVRVGADILCSSSWVDVPAHGRASAWVRFPAPPATVQKVGIQFDGFQPIDDVVIRQ